MIDRRPYVQLGTVHGLLACLLAASGCFDDTAAAITGGSDAAHVSAADAGIRDSRVFPRGVDDRDAEALQPTDSRGDINPGVGPVAPDAGDPASEIPPPRPGAVLCDKRWGFKSEQVPSPPRVNIVPGCCGPSYQSPIGILNGQIVASDARGRIALTGVYSKAVDLGTGVLPIQDPSAQFSAGGAFVLQLDPSCTPVWSRGLLDLAGGVFVTFDPRVDRVHVGVPGADNATLLETLDGTGAPVAESSAQNAGAGARNSWAITPTGAVLFHGSAQDAPVFGVQQTWHTLNVTFEPSGAVKRSPPSAESNVVGTFEKMLAPDGSLSWIASSDTPLVVDGQTIAGSGMFDYVASLDAAGHLAWYKILRESIEVGNSSSIFRVARDAAGNTYALDLLSGPLTVSFAYDLMLRKYDPAGQLVWETRGSFESDHVGYAWLLVDDVRGSVALAFLDATSVQLGAARVTASTETLVLQLDSSGQFAWSRDLEAHDLIAGWTFNPLGELVIAGQSGTPDPLGYELFVTKLAP